MKTNADWQTGFLADQSPPMPITITIPAGTRVKLIEQPLGSAYAVDDDSLLMKLTDNRIDPKRRYVFVPNSIVAV